MPFIVSLNFSSPLFFYSNIFYYICIVEVSNLNISYIQRKSPAISMVGFFIDYQSIRKKIKKKVRIIWNIQNVAVTLCKQKRGQVSEHKKL